MNKGRMIMLGAGVVFLTVIFGGVASALSSSEILLWERLKAHRGLQPVAHLAKLPTKGLTGSEDLSDLLEKLQREERERRLLDSLLSQIADDLDKEKRR